MNMKPNGYPFPFKGWKTLNLPKSLNPLNLLSIGIGVFVITMLIGCEGGPAPQPVAPGTLLVTSDPAGARIFLDGKDIDRFTPQLLEVTAGSHTIRLTLAGRQDWGPTTVTAVAGETTNVFATLLPSSRPPRGLGLRRMDVEAYQSSYVLRAPAASLPSSIDLAADFPRPRSQGRQPSCVGWAVAFAVKSHHERVERGWPLTEDAHVMSPAYVYNQIKVPGGGAYFPDAFNLLLAQGVSSLKLMPYDQNDDRTQPSAAARREAANYKIADWGAVSRTTHTEFVREVKRHLVARTPVLIAVPVYPDFAELDEADSVYDDGSGISGGGHAIVILGYDDAKSAFKIINSWGSDWGIDGYGWIDYAASESLIWEAYVLKDVTTGSLSPEAATDPRPGDAANDVATNTVLGWTQGARTTSFDVYVGTNPELRAVDFQANVSQASFVPDLAPDSTYYWRIDARGAGGITRGTVWRLTTAGTRQPPQKAVSPDPPNNASSVALDVTLSWASGGRTTSYDVYLGTSATLRASHKQGTQSATTFSPSFLAAGTRYYWRVDAKNGVGTTAGDVWTFTTVRQPTAPVSFGDGSIPDQTYTAGTSIATLRLPAASGGRTPLQYRLTPTVPGLHFDATARTLTGTPITASIGSHAMTYTVTDSAGTSSVLTFAITVRPPGFKIYWTVLGMYVPEDIRRAELDGSNIELLVSGSGEYGDIIIHGGKMYFAGGRDKSINRASLDGSNFEVLVTGVVNVTGIAVHNGKVYWTDRYKDKVQRANLDGSNVETIIDDGIGEPEGIAVHNGKMYVINAYSRIFRADLDGSNFAEIVDAAAGGQFFDIEIHDAKMYWTVWGARDIANPGLSHNKIQRANLDGSNVETVIDWPCPRVIRGGRWECARATSHTMWYDLPATIAFHDDKMYWANRGTAIHESGQDRPDFHVAKIQRANPDGSNVETLVTSRAGFGGIAIGR